MKSKLRRSTVALDRAVIDCLAVLVIFLLPVLGAEKIDLSRAVIVGVSPGTVPAKAAAMLRDEIEKRTRITLAISGKIPVGNRPVIVLGTSEDLARRGFTPPSGLMAPGQADAYTLWIDHSRRPGTTICLAGYDPRGALFAAGRLLRALEMDRDRLELAADLKVGAAPRYPLRGHQMGYRAKTNSYDGWTIAMWEQYLRDMAVFGMNAVELVPPRTDDDLDSPHFPKPPMEMMIAMSGLAAQYGLDVWIWYPLADKDETDPKVMAEALRERDEIFRRLPRIDAIFVPSGDPGDVDPKILYPFVEKQKRLLNKYHPQAKIWISPQNLGDDDHWLEPFFDILRREQPTWLDGLVFGPAVEISLAEMRKRTPERYPIRNYPDITHSMKCQYRVPDWDAAYQRTEGREPINPRPYAYAKIFRDLQQYSIGFITYSEGCNDDLNKVIWSCLGWNPEMKIEEILREYARYFIGLRFEKRFAEGLANLEKNWEGPLLKNETVPKTLNLFREMENEATPQDKINWRFQQGLYRAYYDAYIKARLAFETDLERQAIETLKNANQLGALKSLVQAEAILAKADTEKVAADLRARVFELGEALFQSIRMQLSVHKYGAKEISRGANLDTIDTPLNMRHQLEKQFGEIRKLANEKDRLEALAQIVHSLVSAAKFSYAIDRIGVRDLSRCRPTWEAPKGSERIAGGKAHEAGRSPRLGLEGI